MNEKKIQQPQMICSKYFDLGDVLIYLIYRIKTLTLKIIHPTSLYKKLIILRSPITYIYEYILRVRIRPSSNIKKG